MYTKIMLSIYLLTVTVILSPAARADDPSNAPPVSANSLFVEPAEHDFSENAALLDRIKASPHGYFRFINIVFSKAVCQIFSEDLARMPALNLHGDAHLEQYAITDIGRGLTDFDDSSIGPGIIDLMRLGVSIHLAARANNWEDQSEALLKKLLSGYRTALEDPGIDAPEPAVVTAVRSKFTVDRSSYFKWVNSIMQPMTAGFRDSLVTALQPYIDTKRAESPDLPESYFRVVDCGFLRMGIGSALDMKFLVRIAGASEDPMDDIVLECKEVRDLSGIDCISSGRELDPFRILVAQTRIAYAPFEHLGYFRFKGLNFWVHSWVDNYKEVKIGKSFQSPDEMAEVLYDIGIQLGRGHVKNIASPLDLQLRREQAGLLKALRQKIIRVCHELADSTEDAWRMFIERL